jgi:hypothetical protein
MPETNLYSSHTSRVRTSHFLIQSDLGRRARLVAICSNFGPRPESLLEFPSKNVRGAEVMNSEVAYGGLRGR